MVSEITNAFSVISSWAVAVSAIMAAIVAVCKPLRKIFKRLIGSNKVLDELKKTEAKLENEIRNVSDKCDNLEKNVTAKVDAISDKVSEVEQANRQNEIDRLRSEIFRFGNYARKGARISSEEFRSIQHDYEKYRALGGNSIVVDEYAMIVKYYNDLQTKRKEDDLT